MPASSTRVEDLAALACGTGPARPGSGSPGGWTSVLAGAPTRRAISRGRQPRAGVLQQDSGRPAAWSPGRGRRRPRRRRSLSMIRDYTEMHLGALGNTGGPSDLGSSMPETTTRDPLRLAARHRRRAGAGADRRLHPAGAAAGYIDRWSLSETEAGWLVGIFFAAYVAAVPAAGGADRPRAGAAGLSGRHRADGALASRLRPAGRRVLVAGWRCAPSPGIGWAGCYMPGLKAIADPLEGKAQSRAVSWHAAGVGIAGAASFAVAGAVRCAGRPGRGLPVRRRRGGRRAFAIARRVMPRSRRRAPADARRRRALLDFRPVFRNRARDGLDRRLHRPHLGNGGAARLGRHLPRRHHRPGMARRPGCPARPCCSPPPGWPGSSCRSPATRRRSAIGRARVVAWAMAAAAVLSLVTGWSAWSRRRSPRSASWPGMPRSTWTARR